MTMVVIISDSFHEGRSTIVDITQVSDDELRGWVLAGMPEATTELVRRLSGKRSLVDSPIYRFNPHHDKLGKFASNGGSAAGSGEALTAEQYEALRPRDWEYGLADETASILNQTATGRDIVRLADTWRESDMGANQIADRTLDVLHGRSVKYPEDEAQARSLLAVSRGLPAGSLPSTIYRGIDVRNLPAFKAEYKVGTEVDIGPSAFSASRSVAKSYATSSTYYAKPANPIIIAASTRDIQALPIGNLARNVFAAYEEEVIAMGRFKVTSIETDRRDGITTVNVEPTAKY